MFNWEFRNFLTTCILRFPPNGTVFGICSDQLDVGRETEQSEGCSSRRNRLSDGGVSWTTPCADIRV